LILSVAAILAAIAVPAYLAWLPNFRLKGAARNLYSDMRRARLEAVKHNLTRRIVFNTGVNPGTYTIMSPGNDGVWGGGDDEQVKTVNLRDYGSGVNYGSGSAADDVPGNGSPPANPVTFTGQILTFNPMGTANAGYVYLHHGRQTTSYAVGTRITGSVVLRKSPDGGAWTE
jgi:type IV fimbrial biogenesis protein FimT